jgi:putative glutamine amidotransferase
MNKKKPLIGIVVFKEKIDKGVSLGQQKACLNYGYIDAIQKVGGIPILLPIIEDQESIRQQIELMDGIILSGGEDVQPFLYGEEPHPQLGLFDPERDVYEMRLIEMACAQEKPILGICRGLQILNVAFGGTLYQDLPTQYASGLQHSQQAPTDLAAHSVEIIPSTILEAILERREVMINSMHHQAIKQLAPGFIENARAKDGVIEGIEKPDYPFLVAVQWHPERMIHRYPEMLQLFESFVAKAAEMRMQNELV